MLVATAGHVDHGKTTLIRALTGVDTDRLPEERSRGISIDLGFAYWRPDDGETIGFIDVPGHRRYLRNTLAGVGGVAMALLVVAADDGVMPQTVEHLHILDLLGIGEGVVAITKCDRASPERIAEVRGQVAALLTRSGLSLAPVFEVAAHSGTGIAEVGKALLEARERLPRMAQEGLGFRMTVDRAFTVTGAGTVVTGTVISGSAGIGDALVLAPRGREMRVRGVQSGGATVETVGPGQRCALNLAGIEAGEVSRGDWLVEPALHAPTGRFEASLRILPDSPAPLRHGGRVHLHHGAGDHAARVLLPRQRTLQPGEAALAQLILDAPTSAVTGERFILRDGAGQELLGGGQVLDPLPGSRRRPISLREKIGGALALPSLTESLAALAALPGFACGTRWFALCNNLRPDAMQAMLAGADVLCVPGEEEAAIARHRFASLEERLCNALARCHLERPEAGGMTRRELRGGLGELVSADLLAALLAGLSAAGRIDSSGPLVRLPGHVPSFAPAETALWNAARAGLEEGAIRPIVVASLAAELRASEAAVRAMLYRRRIAGDVWQVTENRFLLREHVEALAELAGRLDAGHEGFTAAQFRDASGIGRNFIIELLEFFDRIGVTRRLGEKRRMRAGYESVVGQAGNSGIASAPR